MADPDAKEPEGWNRTNAYTTGALWRRRPDLTAAGEYEAD
jgi:hypothetical protein